MMPLVMLVALAILTAALFARSSRAPFDFSEGESELISGFRIELALRQSLAALSPQHCPPPPRLARSALTVTPGLVLGSS